MSKNRKRLLRAISFLMLAVLLVLSAGCGKKDETVYKFNLAHFFPGTHPAETKFVQGWIKAVDEATKGRVKITSYPGETLVKAADIYNNVVTGVADIGLSCFSYTRGRFPVLEAFELPGIIYANSKSASMTAWEGIKTLNPKEVQDTKLMMVIATGPGDLFTKAPVRKLEDLKGMEIRATGLSAKTIELLGGTPVAMSQAEAYEALSKGIVKGNLSPIEVLKGWKHAEVTKYLTKTPFLYNTLFFVTFNQNKWNALPKDLQKVVTETTEKFHKEVGIGLWDAQNAPALEYAVKEMKMEEITLSQQEAELWISKLSPILDNYASSIKDKTNEDVLKLVKGLADKYNKQYP